MLEARRLSVGHAVRGNSSNVVTKQFVPHPRLEELVRRHLNTRWRAPIAARSLRLFEKILPLLSNARGRLVLDAGCGTGQSTLRLASIDDENLYLGVDRSAVRLAKSGVGEGESRLYGNALLLRMDLTDLWRLLESAGIVVNKTWLLYPNPWPKAIHVKRRWHGHPVWPALLACSAELELRCNWEIYAVEFAHALALSGRPACLQRLPHSVEALSPFERKYADSRHVLWSVSSEAESAVGVSAQDREFEVSD